MLQASDTQVELTSNPRPKPDPDNLVFGKEFADHMLEIEWTLEEGWGKPKICPVHELAIHPASKVLHYATEVGIHALCSKNVKLYLHILS